MLQNYLHWVKLIKNNRQSFYARAQHIAPVSYTTHTVSNKNTHLPVFEISVFRVYLRNHLNYEKAIYIYLHSSLKSFQMKQDLNP